MEVDVNVLTNGWTIAGVTASFLVVVIALLLGINSSRQINIIRKDEKRERLLNEIIEWAEEINNASLTPDISSRIKQHEANVLMRYGISFSRAISIETIANESFKKELSGNVQEVINTLSRFMCIKHLEVLGAMPSKKGFPETVIKEIEKEITEGKNPKDELFYECAKKLAESVRNLLIEANKIKARDVR